MPTPPRFRHGLLLAVLALGLGCGPREAPTIRVGLIGVFTGTQAGSSGIPAREGARLAVAEINEAGGVEIRGRRYPLELIEAEVENRPDAAAVGARRLINLDSVDVIVGPQTSSLAVAAAPVAEESQVLMIAPMASNPLVTQDRRFVFRLAFLDSFQGEVLARFAFDSLGIRRAAILHDAASPYGRDISALFAKTFTDLGGSVVRIEQFDVDGPHDFRPQLRRMIALRPEALLVPNFVTPDSAQLTQARALGFTGRFLGTDSWDTRGLSPSAVQGSLVVGNWDRRLDREMAQRFHTRWAKAHVIDARATAAATYDAIHLIAQSMQRANTRSGLALADTLRNFGRFDGAVAAYDFRGSNDPVRGAALLELGPTGLTIRASVPPTPR